MHYACIISLMYALCMYYKSYAGVKWDCPLQGSWISLRGLWITWRKHTSLKRLNAGNPSSWHDPIVGKSMLDHLGCIFCKTHSWVETLFVVYFSAGYQNQKKIAVQTTGWTRQKLKLKDPGSHGWCLGLDYLCVCCRSETSWDAVAARPYFCWWSHCQLCSLDWLHSGRLVTGCTVTVSSTSKWYRYG